MKSCTDILWGRTECHVQKGVIASPLLPPPMTPKSCTVNFRPQLGFWTINYLISNGFKWNPAQTFFGVDQAIVIACWHPSVLLPSVRPQLGFRTIHQKVFNVFKLYWVELFPTPLYTSLLIIKSKVKVSRSKVVKPLINFVSNAWIQFKSSTDILWGRPVLPSFCPSVHN